VRTDTERASTSNSEPVGEVSGSVVACPRKKQWDQPNRCHRGAVKGGLGGWQQRPTHDRRGMQREGGMQCPWSGLPWRGGDAPGLGAPATAANSSTRRNRQA
jgi:hypothetical protein